MLLYESRMSLFCGHGRGYLKKQKRFGAKEMKRNERKIMDDFIANCDLEPWDERNFLKVEDTIANIHVTAQHVAYKFWYRARCAFKVLFTGLDANDISLSPEDAKRLAYWLMNWTHKYEREDFEND